MSKDKDGTIFVCGGGHQGLSMAAHLSLCGERVNLWNRSAAHIEDVVKHGTIVCEGLISGVAHINKASSDIAEVVTDTVMVTVPSNAHADIARTLAPYVNKDMVIVLNPGRTFGAFEFASVLRECGCVELPHIAETQTIVYTCRRGESNDAAIYALKQQVEIASLRKDDIDLIMAAIPECIRGRFMPVSSVFETSLSNVGLVLHCAPVLFNVGWIENDIAQFKYYYDGISKSVAGFLEKLDAERIAVARRLGFEIESTAAWLRRSYGVEGDSLYECIKNNICYRHIDAPTSIRHRYILEDVPCGLVPVEDAGRKLGVPTPIIGQIVDLASEMLDIDFRESGRKFDVSWLE